MDNMIRVIVTAHRTHWRAGYFFEKGKSIEVGACPVMLNKLEGDPELSVKVKVAGQSEQKSAENMVTLKPEGAALTSAIAEAVEGLKENHENLTQDGDVKVDAVSDHLGYTVTRAEINQALT